MTVIDDSDKYQLDFLYMYIFFFNISGQIPISIGQFEKEVSANKVNWNQQVRAWEPAGRHGGISPRGATQKNTNNGHNGDKAHLRMENGEEMKRKAADVERDGITTIKTNL